MQDIVAIKNAKTLICMVPQVAVSSHPLYQSMPDVRVV
jgi:hypothetical protein